MEEDRGELPEEEEVVFAAQEELSTVEELDTAVSSLIVPEAAASFVDSSASLYYEVMY